MSIQRPVKQKSLDVVILVVRKLTQNVITYSLLGAQIKKPSKEGLFIYLKQMFDIT